MIWGDVLRRWRRCKPSVLDPDPDFGPEVPEAKPEPFTPEMAHALARAACERQKSEARREAEDWLPKALGLMQQAAERGEFSWGLSDAPPSYAARVILADLLAKAGWDATFDPDFRRLHVFWTRPEAGETDAR